MMKYESKRNGQMYVAVTEPDPKYKTVIMRNLETGKEQPITTSTLKRWYKKIEEAVPVAEPVVEEPETVKLVITDLDAMVDCSPCPANEETPVPVYAEVPGIEVDAPEQECYRAGAERYLAALGYELKADKSMPNRLIVRQAGKTYSEVYFGKRALKINVRTDRAEEIEGLAGQYEGNCYFKVIRNYYLPVTIGNIPYTNTAVMVDVFGA